MPLPFISIIVPVYNGELFLSSCLDALLYQTYPKYEIIVVDNNSSDKTSQLLQKYRGNPKVKTTYEPLRSRGAARNKGIFLAKGKIIAMTDVDCIVDKNWLKSIANPIISRMAKIIIGGEVDKLNSFWTKQQQEFNKKFVTARRYDKYVHHLDTKNCAFDASLIKKFKFDPHIANLEDFELKIRLEQQKIRVYYLKECKVSHYHKNSFISLFVRRVNQGYWAAVIQRKHHTTEDPMFDAISIEGITKFVPRVIFSFWKKGFRFFLFEAVTGTAWRIGIIGSWIHIMMHTIAKVFHMAIG